MRRLVHIIDNTQISGTIDRFKSGHCSTSWLLSSGVSHRPPSSLWMKLWLPTKARQLAIWGNTSRASWRNVDLSCLPGLLMMALFMIWCYTRAKLCWRPTVSPWCLNNKPHSLRPGQHHVLLHHHNHLCRQLLHQPALPQRQGLRAHGDRQGHQNRQPSIEVHQGCWKKGCSSWCAWLRHQWWWDSGPQVEGQQGCHSAVNRHGVEPISSVYRYCSEEGTGKLPYCHQELQCQHGWHWQEWHAGPPLPHPHEIQEVVHADVCVCNRCTPHECLDHVQAEHQGSCCGWPVVEELPEPGV